MTRIALFGRGRGAVHAESVTAHPRAEFVWVCDPMEGPAKELAARHGAQATGNVATVLADDAHAVAVYRASGRRLGRELDIDQVLLIGHTGGVWQEITAVPSDPPAFERFWA